MVKAKLDMVTEVLTGVLLALVLKEKVLGHTYNTVNLAVRPPVLKDHLREETALQVPQSAFFTAIHLC